MSNSGLLPKRIFCWSSITRWCLHAGLAGAFFRDYEEGHWYHLERMDY